MGNFVLGVAGNAPVSADANSNLVVNGTPIHIGGSDNAAGITWDTSNRVIGLTIDGITYIIDWTAGTIQKSDGTRWTFSLDPLERFASLSA